MLKYLKYLLVLIALSILCYVLLIQVLASDYSWALSICLSIGIVYFFLVKKINQLNIGKLILVTAFFLILTVPLAGEKETESMEKRTLAEIPQWEWNNVWNFFKAYDKYFNDRFAFRNTLIDVHGKFKHKTLGLFSLTGRVVKGKENWLFLNEPNYIKPISTPFTKKELQRFHYNLVITSKWMENHNIKYYLTIPPVKPRIYEEMLPEFLKIKLSFSKMEQIKAYLEEHSDINYIDYRSELISTKSKQSLYYKTDTHWNEYGAFVGYTKILKTLTKDFPQLKETLLDEYNEFQKKTFRGDFKNMQGYRDDKYLIIYILLRKDSISPILMDNNGLKKTANGFENMSDINEKISDFETWEMPKPPNNLNLFVVRDSYSQHLKKFLSTNFKRSVYAWMPNLPIAKIAIEKPDIVLHEILERFTSTYLKLPPEIENDTAFTNRFNINNF